MFKAEITDLDDITYNVDRVFDKKMHYIVEAMENTGYLCNKYLGNGNRRSFFIPKARVKKVEFIEYD